METGALASSAPFLPEPMAITGKMAAWGRLFWNRGLVIIQVWWGQQIRSDWHWKELVSHIPPKEGARHAMQGYMGKHQGWFRERGKPRQEPLLWFPQDRTGEAAERGSDGLVWIIPAGPGCRGCPRCLAPALEGWGQVDGGPDCESPLEKGVGLWTLPGLVCIWEACLWASYLLSGGIS